MKNNFKLVQYIHIFKIFNIFNVISTLLLISSCAGAKKTSGIGEQIKKGDIGLQSVLDLGRSAYLKGCIDSKNVFRPDATSAFDTCKELAIIYEDELKDILK